MTAISSAMKTFRVIPVMDLMGGVVVAGRSGKRGEYAPLSSGFVESPDPFHFVEKAFGLFGSKLFYIADLDAIMRKGGNAGIMESLATRTPFDFIVDGGYADFQDAPAMRGLTPVFSTESFTGWNGAGDFSNAVVSLDFTGGELVSATEGLTTEAALALARRKGCRRFIQLRMDAVGCKTFDSRFTLPVMEKEEWIYGGGVGSAHDLKTLARLGFCGALVSTALRDGALDGHLHGASEFENV